MTWSREWIPLPPMIGEEVGTREGFIHSMRRLPNFMTRRSYFLAPLLVRGHGSYLDHLHSSAATPPLK